MANRFADFSIMGSGPDYNQTRQQLQNRSKQVGDSIGSLGGSIMNAYNAVKAQEVRDNYNKYKKTLNEKGLFGEKDDDIREQMKQKKQTELNDLRKGQFEYEDIQKQKVDMRGGQFDYEKSQLDDKLKAAQEFDIEAGDRLGGLEDPMQRLEDISTADYGNIGAYDDQLDSLEADMGADSRVESLEKQINEFKKPTEQDLLSMGGGEYESSLPPEALTGLYTEEEVDINDDMLRGERDTRLKAHFGDDTMDSDMYGNMTQMYQPGMKQSEEYYRLSQLLRPYDAESAEKLEDKAFEQSQFEAKLLDDEKRAAAAGPYKDLVRNENYISSRQTSVDQLLQRRRMLDTNDTTGRAEIDGRIGVLNDEITNAQNVGEQLSKGSNLEELYKYRGQGNVPTGAPVVADATAPAVVDVTGNVLADKKVITEALRNNTITPDQAKMLTEDSKLASKQKAAAGAPKKAAAGDWKVLVNNQQYKKQRNDLNEWKNARNYLTTMLDKKDLTQAQRGQLSFRIARVVTGPGVLTENDVNSTKGQSLIDNALQSVGLGGFRAGTDYELTKVKESIDAALNDSSPGQTAVDNLNGMITQQYNELHPGFEKKLVNLNEYITSPKKTAPDTRTSKKGRKS